MITARPLVEGDLTAVLELLHDDDRRWFGEPLLTAEDVADGPAPLGTPMDTMSTYILDSTLRPVPVGVPGELYLGGSGVARGYHDQPRLTAERFIPDPHHPGGRLYRTGDLARWRADGRIDFLGRTDTQVKIRGYRVELGEVASALSALPGVVQAVVISRPGPSSAVKQLVGYLVPAVPAVPAHSESETDPAAFAAELRTALAETLPDYMVPSLYGFVDAIVSSFDQVMPARRVSFGMEMAR